MKYKVYLNALKCDRSISKFMQACDLGVTDVGVPVTISFTINEEPTQEIIQKLIDLHLKSKDEKSLTEYFTDVKLNRVELILEE